MSRGTQDPLVISFYTENTPYQLEVLALISSCNELGIEAEIEGVPSEGSWERNCALKPFFIRKKLLEKKRPVFGWMPTPYSGSGPTFLFCAIAIFRSAR